MISSSKKLMLTISLFFPLFSRAMESNDAMDLALSVNVETKKKPKKLEFYNGYLSKKIDKDHYVQAVAFYENNVIYGTSDGIIQAVDLNHKKYELYRFLSKNKMIDDIAFNKNFAASSFDNSIVVADLKTKSSVSKLAEPHSAITQKNLHFIGDDKLVSSSNRWVTLWDLPTQKRILSLRHEKNPNACTDIRALCSNLIVGLFASGSIDNDIKLWDIKSGKLVKCLKNKTPVTSLNFKSDNNRLLFSGSDTAEKTIKVWDIVAGDYIQSIDDVAQKDCYGVGQLVFNHNGSILATSGYERNTKFWDWQTGECLYSTDDTSNKVIAFHGTQNRVALGVAEKPASIFVASFKKRTDMDLLEQTLEKVRIGEK